MVAPLEAAFWDIPPRGSFEPLAGFHARGVSHMFIKGDCTLSMYNKNDSYMFLFRRYALEIFRLEY